MKIKMNMMTKLMIYFLVLIIGPMAVLGTVSYNKSKNSLQKEAETTLNANLNKIGTEINGQLKNTEDIGSILGNLPQIKDYAQSLTDNLDNQINERPEEVVIDFRNSIKEVCENIFIINKNGDIILDGIDGSYVGLDVSQRDYFKHGIAGENYWSDVLLSKVTNKPVIVYSIPFIDRDEDIQGVIALTIKFDTITKTLAEIQIGQTGYAYMIDKTGVFLYHPESNKILNENAYDVDSDELKEITEKMMKGESGLGYYTYAGVRKLNIFMPVGKASVGVTLPVDEYMTAANDIRKNTLMIVVFAVLIGALIAYLASRQITKPINHLKELMAKAGNGDMTVEANIITKDEIGELANSFNDMIIGASSAMREVNQSAQQVGSSSQETSSISEEMAASMENQTQSMNELTNGVNDMSKSINEVASSITDMASNINNIRNNMEELGKSSNEVGNDVENAANAVVNVSNSIEEMNSSIELVANNSVNARKEAESTVRIAQDGKQVVDNTIIEMDNINNAMVSLTEAVKGLGKAAIQIGDIIEVIDDIAEQTNLLALNASIEAARAGEHGKGFAVVAGAIGSLAEKSSDATKDITKLIKQIQEDVDNAVNTTKEGADQVEKGVGLVKNTGVALDKIFTAIAQTTELIKEIAQSTEDQSKASEEIVEGIEQVNKLSMNVSSSVEEQISAIENVINDIEKLDVLGQEVASAAEQQAAGVEEILATSESVNETGNQVSAASEEVASTAQSLSELSVKLIEVVNTFKL